MNKFMTIIDNIRLSKHLKNDFLLLNIPPLINLICWNIHKRIFVEYIGPYICTQRNK